MNLAAVTGGIGNVLRHRTLAVPVHQRPYAWKLGNVTALWDDLQRARLEAPEGYFLGQLVLGDADPNAATAKVIDGQQRLATITLLYAAAVRLFHNGGDGERAGYFRTRFLQDLNPATLERRPKLQLTVDDDVFFQALVTAASAEPAQQLPAPSRESHKLLLAAYTFLSEKLAAATAAAGTSWQTQLVQILDFVEKSVEIIEIQVGSDQNAYLIFETLNDRGVRLTTADLLKNMVYGKAGPQLGVVQDAWTRMVQNLDSLNDDDAVTTFLRHHWISTEAHVREKELYKKISSSVNTSTAVVQLTSGLVPSSDNYAALLSPSDPQWTSTPARDALELIRLFRVITVRPLLLAIVEGTSGTMQAAMLVAVGSWSLRLAVAGGLGTGTTEEALGAAARAVRTGSVASVAALRAHLGNVIVDDETFRTAFSTYRPSNTKQSRHLLIALEKQAARYAGDPVEQVPNPNETVVNLEHVMPRRPDVAGPWATLATSDQYSVYVARLGNHALMLATANMAVANDDFTTKQAAYVSSTLRLTNELSLLTAFTFAEVDARQNAMAALAVKAWAR